MLGTSDAPASVLETNGEALSRRVDRTGWYILATALLLVAVVVLVSVNIGVGNGVGAAVSSARAQFASVQSVLTASAAASGAGAASISPELASSIAAMLSCRRPGDISDGLSAPVWIVLGDRLSRGDGVYPEGKRWYHLLKQAYEGAASASSTRILLVPAGDSLPQQLISLSGDEDFQSAAAHREPFLVFYSMGFEATLAAALPQQDDPRALRADQIGALDATLLTQDWLSLSDQTRVVFLVQSLPYSPSSHPAYLPSAFHACSDPLASASFNSPASIVESMAVERAPSSVAMLHVLSSLSPVSDVPEDRVNVLRLDRLLSDFTWIRAALDGGSNANVAFGSDCLTLGPSGQALLASYLDSCLQGKEFEIPSTLL